MDTKVDVDKMEDNKTDDNLQFQDISHTVTIDNGNMGSFDEYDDNEDDRANLLGDPEDIGNKSSGTTSSPSTSSMFSLEFYQSFFQVDTPQVLERMKRSFLPSSVKENFLKDTIRPNPDLYGPFWICLTLVFTSAIVGNITSYLQSSGVDNQWNYDFNKVSLAASVIFGYWWLMSSVLWAGHRWRSSSPMFTFIEVVCVYGYSLTAFIPVSVLCVVQLVWLQWLLISLATLLSGLVLVKTMWPSLSQNSNKFTYIGAAVILIMHILLALVFKLYFFETMLQEVTTNTTTIGGSTVDHVTTSSAAIKLSTKIATKIVTTVAADAIST